MRRRKHLASRPLRKEAETATGAWDLRVSESAKNSSRRGMSMGATWRGLLRAGVLVVSAVVTVSCAAPQMLESDPDDLKKLKVKKLRLDPKNPNNPVPDLEFEHPNQQVLDACTQPMFDAKRCPRLGFPLKKDGTEYLGTLTLDPVLILTDIASPGETCVCYGNKCKCTK